MQDHAGEVKVRTRHSPLHWVQEQLPPPAWTTLSSSAAPEGGSLEWEEVSCEAEHAPYQEEHASGGGEGGGVGCDRDQD